VFHAGRELRNVARFVNLLHAEDVDFDAGGGADDPEGFRDDVAGVVLAAIAEKTIRLA
jgi:hypothetical protein